MGQESGLVRCVTRPEEESAMFSWSGSATGDSPFVEVPLIISKEQMHQLEVLANNRGQSVGSLVRQMLNCSLSRLKDGEGSSSSIPRMRSSA